MADLDHTDNTAKIFLDGESVTGPVPNEDNTAIPIGIAKGDDVIEFTLKYEPDPDPFDADKLPGVIYFSDEPRQILEALPGWLRRLVVAYGRFRLRRKK